MSVEVVMDTAGNATAGGAYVAHEDYRAGAVMYSFVGGSSSYSGGNVTMVGSFYDLDNVEFIPGREHRAIPLKPFDLMNVMFNYSNSIPQPGQRISASLTVALQIGHSNSSSSPSSGAMTCARRRRGEKGAPTKAPATAVERRLRR